MNKELIDSSNKNETHLTRRGKVVLGGTALLFAMGASFGLGKVAEAAQPDFSSETTVYTVDQNDGLNNAASTIDGIDAIDIRDATGYIEDMASNKDVLKDGLQPAEQLDVPKSVTP